MFHVVGMAEDAGWAIDEDILCPEHAIQPDVFGKEWSVGCYTCGWEESLGEDDARYEYKEHECEPETYLKSPADLARRTEHR